jgi:hypothetical protein
LRRARLVRDRMNIELPRRTEEALRFTDVGIVDSAHQPISTSTYDWNDAVVPYTLTTNATGPLTYTRATTYTTVPNVPVSVSNSILPSLHGMSQDEINEIVRSAKEAAEKRERDLEERAYQQRKRKEEKESIKKRYKEWIERNKGATASELNSDFFNFRMFQSRKSLEFQLLKAIAEKAEYNTQTTSYDPVDGYMYLYTKRIAKINSNFEVTKVCLPIDFVDPLHTDNINLFRHRLRQIGLRCLYYNGATRLCLGRSYITLEPGVVYTIPASFRKPCLPPAWLEKLKVELTPIQPFLPLQDNLHPFFSADGTVELQQHTYSYRDYQCSISLRLEYGYVTLKASAMDYSSLNAIPLHCACSMILLAKWYEMGALHHVENLKRDLNKVIDEERIRRPKRTQVPNTVEFVGYTEPGRA